MIIEEIGYMKGHQDLTGKTLSTMEKLNVIMDKLATKAISEAKCSELEWHKMLVPMLKIDGKTITRKKGLMLSIAAENEELHE